MATPTPQLTRIARVAAGCGLALALLAGTGCVGLSPFTASNCDPCKDAPTGTPCQVTTTWHREVDFVPDPTHDGQLTPGIAGRLYLFGPEIGFPLLAEGTAVVELFDETPRPTGPNPVALEQWRVDPVTLKRLCKKDTIGWGYTLFLPWGTYRPDIGVVKLKVRFEPAKGGAPLYAPESPLTLDHSNNPAMTNGLNSPTVPGAPQARIPQPVSPGMMPGGPVAQAGATSAPTGQTVPMRQW
jgi:hypothetical protein